METFLLIYQAWWRFNSTTDRKFIVVLKRGRWDRSLLMSRTISKYDNSKLRPRTCTQITSSFLNVASSGRRLCGAYVSSLFSKYMTKPIWSFIITNATNLHLQICHVCLAHLIYSKKGPVTLKMHNTLWCLTFQFWPCEHFVVIRAGSLIIHTGKFSLPLTLIFLSSNFLASAT